MHDGHAPQAVPLATEPAGFFGRSDALCQVSAAISGGWRLITLLGPPGIGKTRLARRVITDLEPMAVFVELAGVRDRDGLAAAAGVALSVSFASARDTASAEAAVARALSRSPRAVLVLDGLDAEDAALTDVVRAWIEGAPRAVVIATARDKLRLAGECAIELPPLSVAAGVALFEERARGALGRALSDDERAAAEALVRRVGGVPLAIEMAAGAVAAAGVGAVNARRESASADVAAWAVSLLDAGHRQILADVTVLAPQFTLADAEAVSTSTDPATIPVADALNALCQRALMRAHRDRASGVVRFAVDDVVGAAVLANDTSRLDRGAALLRLAQDFARRAAALDVADEDNLARAFDAAKAAGDGAVVASIAKAMAPLFRRHGTRPAHEAILACGIDGALAAGRADLERDLVELRAACARAAGENTIALACEERALALSVEAKDGGAVSSARARRGQARFERGDVDGGLADVRAAVEEAARLKDAAREAFARNRLGLALFRCGSTTSALDELTRAASLAARASGNAPSLASLRQRTLLDLASAHRKLGAIEAAAQRLLELGAHGGHGTRGARPAHAHATVDDRAIDAAAALEHAAVARASGRAEDALRLVDDAVAGADDDGGPRLRTGARVELAAALVDLGRAEQALATLDEALAIATLVENPIFRAHVLLETARARADRGDADTAKRALDGADEALAVGEDAACEGAVLVERALLAAADGDERGARAFAEKSLLVLQRVGGKPLVVALAVAGLVDSARLDDRRVAAEALLARYGDVDARAAVAILRGQPAPECSLARRLLQLRGGKARREIVVGADCRYYELDGQRISLQRQRSLRLILLALIDHAVDKPGIGMSQTEVLARGWPGEKMRADSGATRVYTSIRRLRRGGLAGVLLTRDDGYLLDPSVSVRRA